MYTCTIGIADLETARKFVTMTSKYMNTKITLKSGDYCIDGHSIIGVISLDMSKPITLSSDDNAPKALLDDLKPYAI